MLSGVLPVCTASKEQLSIDRAVPHLSSTPPHSRLQAHEAEPREIANTVHDVDKTRTGRYRSFTAASFESPHMTEQSSRFARRCGERVS